MTTSLTTTSPLLRMTQTSPTCLWNDSADPRELRDAIGWGAVGATCNPVIALAVLKADKERWTKRIADEAAANPSATESEIGWSMVRHLSVEAAALLEPIFHEHSGRNGRLSIQTDPIFHRDADRLAAQAVEFSQLAPNMIVKIPVTAAGVRAIEEATFRGVSINATVSFTVAQSVAVAEAVERGLARREAEGLPIDSMGPVCTIMVGRTDDWIKVAADKQRVSLDPGYYEWAGVAVFKHAYRIYQERGFRTRLLSAAFRNHMHWSEFVGGDVVVSPPYGWQTRFNISGIEPEHRIDTPVDPRIVDTLHSRLEEFRKAYDADGMAVADFDAFGATRHTLRQFLGANNELEALVRDVVVPNPAK
jgi:transaldolase